MLEIRTSDCRGTVQKHWALVFRALRVGGGSCWHGLQEGARVWLEGKNRGLVSFSAVLLAEAAVPEQTCSQGLCQTENAGSRTLGAPYRGWEPPACKDHLVLL